MIAVLFMAGIWRNRHGRTKSHYFLLIELLLPKPKYFLRGKETSSAPSDAQVAKLGKQWSN